MEKNLNNNLKQVIVSNFFIEDGKILLLHRIKDQKYSPIGGTVEANESIEDACLREIHEEVGIAVEKENLELIHCISAIEQGQEKICFYFVVTDWQGEPKNMETTKHDHMEWFDLNNLPNNLLTRSRQAITMMQKCILYSEQGWE